MLRTLCGSVLALLMALMFFAAPAHAAVCDRFSQPFTQASLAQFASEVRSLFPEKYRNILASVRLTVVDDRYDVLEIAQGEAGSEITVSSTYLHTSCSLAMWPMIFTPDRTDMRRSITTLKQHRCQEVSGEDYRTCMLGYMAGVAEGWERGLTDSREVDIQTPLVQQMVISSFMFALAHEYAHVLLDKDKTPFANVAKRDAELAADLQALSIYASGRVWPIADTLLFTGRREFDALVAGDNSQTAAHDPAYCRAQRSAAIRQRIVPSINTINGWRGGQDVSFIFAMVPMTMNNLTLVTPDIGIVCNLALPSELEAMANELATLAQWTERWPQVHEDQKRAMQALLAIRFRTEAGAAALAGMVTSYVVAPDLATINGALGGTLGPVEAQSWASRFALADALFKGDLPVIAKDVRKLMLAKAYSDFLASPKESVLGTELRKAEAAIHRAYEYGTLDGSDLLVTASFQILNGDCQRGLENAFAFSRAIENPVREFGSLSAMAGQTNWEIVRQNNSEVAETAANANNTQITPDVLEKCTASGALLRERLAANMGWKLAN